VESQGLPRRASSRSFDDQNIDQLDNRRPSDCVLLFTSRSPGLLRDKLAKTRRGTWKAYPHVALSVCAAACMTAAKRLIYGSSTNVGRALRNGEPVEIRRFDTYTAICHSDAQELLIPADRLENRVLPVSAIRAIRCFSSADAGLLQDHLRHIGQSFEVRLETRPPYVEGQSQPPGSECLDLTRGLYQALLQGNEGDAKALLDDLARRCFD